GLAGAIVDQRGEGGVDRRQLRQTKHGERSLAHAWLRLAPCSDQIEQKTSGIIVILIQGNPTECRFLRIGSWGFRCTRCRCAIQNLNAKTVNPLAEQRRLSKTGGGGDEGEGMRQSSIQQFYQPLSRYEVWSR